MIRASFPHSLQRWFFSHGWAAGWGFGYISPRPVPVQGERASRRAVRALLLRVASVKPLDDLQEPQVSGDVMVENLSLTHTTYTHTHTRPTAVEVTLLGLCVLWTPQQHHEADIVWLSQAPLPHYQQPLINLPILKRGSAPPLAGPRTWLALSPQEEAFSAWWSPRSQELREGKWSYLNSPQGPPSYLGEIGGQLLPPAL